MKTVEKSEATRALAEYASEIGGGPVVVTDHGQPVAVLVSVQDADLETVSLGTNRQFLDLIDQSRSRAREEGPMSGEEMPRRFS